MANTAQLLYKETKSTPATRSTLKMGIHSNTLHSFNVISVSENKTNTIHRTYVWNAEKSGLNTHTSLPSIYQPFEAYCLRAPTDLKLKDWHSVHTVFTCFVFIWEQMTTCATYSINWLVFITKMKSGYSAVRTGSLNKAVCASSLKG